MLDAANYARELVLAQTGMSALIGTRCYARTLKKDDTVPAAVVNEVPGGWVYNELQERRFSVYCWGANWDAAMEVLGTLADALDADGADRQTIDGERLFGITLQETGQPQYDEDLERYYAEAVVRFVMGTS